MNKSESKSLSGTQLVDTIISSLKEKLAEDIVLVDMQNARGTADWFIICQGDNTSHTSSIADGVVNSLKEHNTRPWHQEGTEDGRWILIDYTDVVLHIMLPELREYYDLESLWSEGSIQKISTH